MNTELHVLRGLLIVAIFVAPWVTSRFFLRSTKLHDALYLVCGSLTIASLSLDVPALSFAWPLFCVNAFGIFVHQRFAHLRSPDELAKCVPFVFAIIGSVWLSSGANDLRLLGYGESFSYYAALHGHVLGWMIVGGIAYLANQPDRFQRVHLVAVYICLVSFLLIAFGIDGVPFIKPVGVAGITLMVGASQLLFLTSCCGRSKPAFALGLVSFVGFLLTIALAWQNEVGSPPAAFFGVRGMVSLHGVLNGVVVAPFFALALQIDRAHRKP